MAVRCLQHNIHPVVKSLIESLLCDVDERLGSHGGAEEIKVGCCDNSGSSTACRC